MLSLVVFLSFVTLSYCSFRFPLHELDTSGLKGLKNRVNEAKKTHHGNQHKRSQNEITDALANIENYFVTTKDCGTVQSVGGSLIVQQGGATILKKVYGKADRENNVDFSFDTLMSVGSVGKQISSFVVGSLVDEGVLNFDDMISKHLPEWWSTNDKRKNDVAATIEDALGHRLGLSAYDMAWFANISSLPLSTLVQNFENKFPIRSPVRSQWFYDNYGYAVIAAVAEKVTGKSWSQLVRERFIDKLGLTGKMYATQQESLQHDYAYPYELTINGSVLAVLPRGVNTIIDNGGIQAAGSYTLSTNAMEIYLTQLYNHLPTVVSEGIYQRSTSTWQSIWPSSVYLADFNLDLHGYGYGWIIGTYRGRRFHAHNGGTNGHSTMVFVFPDDGISTSAFLNIDGIDLGTYIFLNLYIYDQLSGFESIITPELTCFVSTAYFNNLPSVYEALSTNVTNADKLVGTYQHSFFKTFVVTQNADGTLTGTLGSVAGKLRNQGGDANAPSFAWYLENNWSLLGFEVSFSQRNAKRDESTSKFDIVGINLAYPEGINTLVSFSRVN